MTNPSADRNLLFGILALQMDFISREQLIAAMNAWVLDKSKPLSQILHGQGALSRDNLAWLEAGVEKHLAAHDNKPETSLAAVSTMHSVKDELQRLADPDLQSSLAHVSSVEQVADYQAAQTMTVGATTSQGQRFRVLRPHAKGGLGEVFVAQDLELHREVALKEIQFRFADQPDSRSRFVLEAEITGGLEHPGIVPVYGLGQYEDGRPFYAMRFIRGDSLKEAIERFHRANVQGREAGERTLELRKLLGRFIDVCEAIEYAHSRGVLHRDLKPGNIMLGKYGETLVVDWGLAKSVGRDERHTETAETTLQPDSGSGTAPTQLGSAIGTPAFMSPEQAAGRLDQLGPATDVYSLGATLYTLLTGQPPFGGGDVGEILRRTQRGEFPPPRQIDRGIDPALEAICLRAMALRPAERYPAAKTLANEVEHWLADEPVTAHSERWLRRAARWGRRHRALVSSAAVLLLTAVTALSVGLVLVGRKQTEVIAQRNAAQKARDQAEAVNRFYEHHVLAAARPKGWSGGSGKDLSLREALDQAALQIDKAFTEQPEVEAAVRNTLGMTYWYLGQFAAANPHLERAHEIRLARLGPQHADTLTSVHNLSRQRWRQGNNAEAAALVHRAWDGRRRALGDEHEDTLASKLDLGMLLTNEGRVVEAEQLLREAIATCRRTLGSDHRHTLYGQNDLAVLLSRLGRLAESAALNRQTLEGRRSSLGSDHPDTLRSMSNLASSLRALGHFEESESLARQSLAGRLRVLGPDHLETLWAQWQLASVLGEKDKFDEAKSIFQKAIAAARRFFGPEHPDTMMFQSFMAFVLSGQGMSNEAEGLFRETLAQQRRVIGPEKRYTLITQRGFAEALHDVGNLEESEAQLRELLAAWRKNPAADQLESAATQAGLGDLLLDRDQYEEAERLLREALANFEKILPPQHWRTSYAQRLLGCSLARQGKFAEAEPLAVAGCAALTQSAGGGLSSQSKARAFERIIEMYDKLDRPEQSARWRAEAAKVAQ